MIRRDPRQARTGFTLIELMVVIVIIGILLALLLPVIVGAVRKAHEARVAAEIQTIAMGLAKFKDTYGEYPPSRVILSETGVYTAQGATPRIDGAAIGPVQADFNLPLNMVAAGNWYATTTPTFVQYDISFGELASRSLRILRKMYPRGALASVDRNGNGTIEMVWTAGAGLIGGDYWPDFNGNAGTTKNNVLNQSPDPGFIYLEGHECLVFFLGGIPIPTANANGTISFGGGGLGKDPQFPFKNSNGVVDANNNPMFISTTNRILAFYEFKGDRLVDTDDGDGIPGYLDPNSSGGVGTYYAYFASYGSIGYDPNDVNFGDAGDLNVGNTYRIGMPTMPVSAPPNTVYSPTPNPYTSSPPLPLSSNQSATFIQANSFQIISSGGDQLFGPGGQWTTSGDRLPLPPGAPAGIRDPESDNITNFASGRLN